MASRRQKQATEGREAGSRQAEAGWRQQGGAVGRQPIDTLSLQVSQAIMQPKMQMQIRNITACYSYIYYIYIPIDVARFTLAIVTCFVKLSKFPNLLLI